MKALRDLLDKVEPIAAKNKYAHTLYDALSTLLFQPNEITHNGVHIKDGMDLKRTMVHVVLAMQLALIHGIVNVGHQHYLSLGLYEGLTDGIGWKLLYGALQIIPLILVVHVVGLGIEIIFAAIKKHPVEEGFLVSGMLIPLIMPPDVPLWIVALGTAFAVLIAKEAFGGTGMNILNIALTARVFIFFAYPSEISGDTVWVAHDYNLLHDLVDLPEMTRKALGLSALPEGGWKALTVDGFSGATPLALAAKGGWEAVQGATLPNGDQQYSTFNLLMGFIPGSVGEMNKVFILLGALMLIGAQIASWRIMLSMVAGLAVAGLSMNILALTLFPDSAFIAVPWYDQFLMGSFFFAMAFMATDPVTAAGTNAGKFIYGFLIGVLGMIVRVLNPAYPEGWMLAILFMNVFAPLIDHVVLSQNIKRRLSRVAG